MPAILSSRDESNSTQITAFNILAFLGVFLNVAALAPALFLPTVHRRTTWYGLVTSWIIYSTSYLLLLGRQTGPEPPFGLCICQAALIYAAPSLYVTPVIFAQCLHFPQVWYWNGHLCHRCKLVTLHLPHAHSRHSSFTFKRRKSYFIPRRLIRRQPRWWVVMTEGLHKCSLIIVSPQLVLSPWLVFAAVFLEVLLVFIFYHFPMTCF